MTSDYARVVSKMYKVGKYKNMNDFSFHQGC